MKRGKIKVARLNRHLILLVWLGIASLFCFGGAGERLAFATEKWAGIDDAVVGKVAEAHGRKPSEPWVEGDLQLFLFLMAGAVGGFCAGYYWRVLTGGRNKNSRED